MSKSISELRDAWKSAINEETSACEALRVACVDGCQTNDMVNRCSDASKVREVTFIEWAKAKDIT